MNKEQTLELISSDQSVRDISDYSEWLIALIQREEKKGYRYNRDLEDAAKTELGMETNDSQRRLLSALIYESRKEADRRATLAKGYVPATSESCEALLGQQVEILTDGAFGTATALGKLVKTQNGFFVLPGRNRTRGYRVSEWIKAA